MTDASNTVNGNEKTKETSSSDGNMTKTLDRHEKYAETQKDNKK